MSSRIRDAMRRSTSSSVATSAAAMTRTFRLARQSGCLNLSSRDFHTFPDEIFRLYELLDEDEHSWECAVLRKLDLSYNEIAELPSQVETLKYLISFKMRHNHLQQLPLALWNLETLTSLDLSNNKLEGCLSEQLGKLYKLRELGLEGNMLTKLPDSIGELVHLEVLRVENNQLRTFPSTIGRLRNLKTLSAHSNQITDLPLSFGLLTGLLTLDMSKNRLVTMGDALPELVSIKYIDLRQNKLEVFPTLPKNNTCLDQLFLGFNMLREIPDDIILNVMESITVLDVRDNKLQHLSDRIPQLYRLKTLDVTNNDLHDLPAGLGYLKHLDHLLVEGNPLRSIRRAIISSGTEPLKKYLRTRGGPPVGVDAMEEEVDEFTIRQRNTEQDEPMAEEPPHEDEYLFRNAAASGNLHLVDMKLKRLPDQLHSAGKYNFGETLLQLDISENWLLELPEAIGDLKSLHSLTAEKCGLKSVHPSIAMIPSLEHLRLSKNSLTTDAVNAMLVAESRSSICLSLKELDLRNNNLTDIPQKLQYLELMDTLVLSSNRLRVLDGFPWSTMRQLSVLSVANNRLESCGTVHQVPKLTSLSLENNELRQIPVELALCDNLRALYLAGNPQRGIRAHILSQGTEAVLKFLRNRLSPHVLEPTTGNKPHKSVKNAASPRCVPQSNQNTDGTKPQHRESVSNTLELKQLRVDASTSPSEPSTSKLSSSKPPPALASVEGTVAAAPSIAEDEVLVELNAKILKLEQQLDDFAVTAAKRFALKKDLAMTRSLKIRHLRKTGQKP
ncbi:hypothetical protein KXD40_000149 [Peronospora effusa]|uniref:Disease resistance R13L4/SHOC-2-like LRR domain-containing protein n=1 Tax=Peronospora effusa TaxID=542832 RepID=A0A3M6VHJ9_9STRA|nr:hypothetical protein DD238_001236 [Peronospora effusa]RQM17227.1 hypothetical protein DD237_001849 [Peronospora effusa]UIZ20682.1 hypothetical protein KXD40_000149 [Peronospora effusa]CAI5718491.1 unnamed protein product [Peronospora effusa]